MVLQETKPGTNSEFLLEIMSVKLETFPILNQFDL